jgi:FG-GAP-like repeat
VVSTSSANLQSVAVLTAQSNYTPAYYDGFNYPSVQISDVDNDGDLDIVAVDFSLPSKLYVLKNNGTGLFTVPAATTTTSPSNNTIVMGDINNDSVPDMLLLSTQQQPVDVYLGDGTGEFVLSSTLNPIAGTNATANRGALGDTDNDGDLDFVVTINSDIDTEDGVYLYKNDGAGNFSSSGVFLMPNPNGVRLVDADGDLDLDVYAIAQTKDSNNVTTAINLHLLLNNP